MKTFSTIKSLCKTKSQRLAFNKLVNTFVTEFKIESEPDYTVQDMIDDAGGIENIDKLLRKNIDKYFKDFDKNDLLVIDSDDLFCNIDDNEDFDKWFINFEKKLGDKVLEDSSEGHTYYIMSKDTFKKFFKTK